MERLPVALILRRLHYRCVEIGGIIGVTAAVGALIAFIVVIAANKRRKSVDPKNDIPQ